MIFHNTLCIPDSVDTALSQYRRSQLLCQALPGISLSGPQKHNDTEQFCRDKCFRREDDSSTEQTDSGNTHPPNSTSPQDFSTPRAVSFSAAQSTSYDQASFETSRASQMMHNDYFRRNSTSVRRLSRDCDLIPGLDWEDSSEQSESEVDWPDLSRFSKRRSSNSSNADSVASSWLSPPLSHCDSSYLFTRLQSGASLTTEAFHSAPILQKRRFQLPPSAPTKPRKSSFIDFNAARKDVCKSITSRPDLKPNALHPAKTGFALWVGNLGPKTTLQDLRDLFGTPKSQSIYLIQRTGCAFVNYADEDGSNDGLRYFDMRGKKLHDHDLVVKAQIAENPNGSEGSPEISSCKSSEGAVSDSSNTEGADTRYFICKSLTVEDLELAKHQNKWSTQLRNKGRLNSAFHTSKCTYLVFSANRTSAFYGIARSEEEFVESSNENEFDASSHNNNVDSNDTESTEIRTTEEKNHPIDGLKIPEGVIVIDSLRGSQFWKASGCTCVEPDTNKWTAPAKITWLSPPGSMVPFCHTRHMKNSSNSNKPVKVARDGTEIDPVIGAQLLTLFSA